MFKKICVPISNRTNYSKLKPVLIRLRENPFIHINIVPSSSIVINRVGNSLLDIEKDHFDICDKVECLLMNDSLEGMAKTSGLSLIEHSSIFSRTKPDAVLVVGDRFDMLPSVLAARMMNIPILHIQGGERSGSIDDTVRDIISICSDRHYAATVKAYNHVVGIAHNKHVLHVGCPAVEYIQSLPVGKYLDCSTFEKKYKDGFNIQKEEPYIVVAVHPNTTEDNDINMITLLESVLSFDMKTIVMYPNIDAFNHVILGAIYDFKSKITCVKHMPLVDFVKLMAHATCFVGNSSAGIRETASFGTPTVNVGNRQIGRERNANTIDCGISKEDITSAVSKAISNGRFDPVNIYYKKNSTYSICQDIYQLFGK